MNSKPAIVFALLIGMAGCDGSDQNGAAAGEPCQFVNSIFPCDASASLCYAAGLDSSCRGGALCIGDGSGMLCAHPCKRDSDCASTSATAVCMQGCTARIINGFCVEPAQRSELLQMTCSSDDKDVAGTSGVSN